jgi:hypothetical protein
MRPYNLYQIETFKGGYITQVAARSNKECRRKAWKAIFKKAPRLVQFFRINPFICINQGDSGWGRTDLG